MRNSGLILAATILASSLAFIDGTIVIVALPTIQEDFGAGFDAAQWVVNGYALMLAALVVVTGGLGDRYGRRRMFVAGIIAFTAASIACALAPSIEVLIAARGIQGIGAALLVPQSLAIISASFPRERRGRAIGTWAAASGATTAFGPPLGGFLVDAIDWRAAFWINVPLAAVALWLTFRAVPESRDPDARGGIDWIGAVLALVGFGLLAAGLTAFSRGIMQVGVFAWTAIVGGILALVTFALVERRVANPLVPPALFRSRTFTGANLLTVFLYGCLAATLFLLPYELNVRRGLRADETGLALMPFGVIVAVGSRFTGGLSDRYGQRLFLVLGSALVAVACAWFAIAFDNFWLGVMAPLVLLSVGMTVVISPLTTAVMNAVPETRAGAASSVNNAAARVGGLLAVAAVGALAGMIYIAVTDDPLARFGILPDGEAARAIAGNGFLVAYRSAMWFAAGWAALAAIAAAIFLRERGDSRSANSAAA
ncbi:MAG: MFS transporter [Bauldia sp.]|nr:MFS transporter [Bauldia sp.]